MIKTFLRYSSIASLALSLVILAFVTVGMIAAAPDQQDVNDTPITVNILSGSGITSALSGTPYVAINYGVADCTAYSVVTETAINTATFIVQHAVVSGRWVTGTIFTPQDATEAISLGVVPLHGRWTRGYVYLANSYPVTVSLDCVLKNRVQ